MQTGHGIAGNAELSDFCRGVKWIGSRLEGRQEDPCGKGDPAPARAGAWKEGDGRASGLACYGLGRAPGEAAEKPAPQVAAVKPCCGAAWKADAGRRLGRMERNFLAIAASLATLNGIP